MSDLMYPDVPLHELMRATAQRHPTRVAIRFHERTITFQRFDELSNQLAHGLRHLGLTPGQRLALYMPNCPEFELGFYAASKLGAIACALNPAYREFEVTHQVNDSGSTVLLTHATLWPLVEATWPKLPGLRHIVVVGGETQTEVVHTFESLLRGQSTAAPAERVSSDDVVALPYSSGTTGRPKGVMLTHRNLVANHIQFGTASALGPDDVYLVYLPLAHIYGTALMGLSMWSGAQQILLEALVLEHSDVIDCAVIGVPDAAAGEVPRAYVVPRPGCCLDPAALTAFVEARAASYKAIRQWEIVDSIPRTPSGKVLRRVLKERAERTF